MIRARRGRFLAILNPDRLTQAVSEHEDLMQAFRDMDPDAAARVWDTHLRHTGETLANVLKDQADSSGAFFRQPLGFMPKFASSSTKTT